MQPDQRNKPSISLYRQAFNLIQSYFFHSSDRRTAWPLLIGAVVSIVAMVALTSVFSSWMISFNSALIARDLSLFFASLRTFGLIICGWVSVNALKDYCIDTLKRNWMDWLKRNMLHKYLKGDINYLDLHRHAEQLPNPEQRISEDTRRFVDSTITLSLELLDSILRLTTFIGSLWVIGGSLKLFLLGVSLTIPGYMVWAAVGFATVASIITHTIGRNLVNLNQKEESLGADERELLHTLSKDAENIAQEHGDIYFHRKLLNNQRAMSHNWGKKILIKIYLTVFNSFYQLSGNIFPYLVAAPAYFAKAITLAQLMQISFEFMQVQSALSWFVEFYKTLANYKASTMRLIELENTLEKGGLVTTERNIVVTEKATNEIQVELSALSKPTPTSTSNILSNLSIHIPIGTNTLFQGPNGTGKSTVFKVLSGTWNHGSGEVSLPKGITRLTLPQKPTILKDSLRANLAYPDTTEAFTNAQYVEALRLVGLEALTPNLDAKDGWCGLSGGEQQKLAFARAILRKPDVLFLDEATAAMDNASEDRVYSLSRGILSDTTLISIAHCDVAEYHHQTVKLSKDGATQLPIVQTSPHCASDELPAAPQPFLSLTETL